MKVAVFTGCRADLTSRAIGIAVASLIVFTGMLTFGTRSAVALNFCPGQLTADGLGCCAQGSTPTGDDNCQLAGGGLAASCPAAQVTVSGTCCPQGYPPLANGSCTNNSNILRFAGDYPVTGCPLDQLDKGGLLCCPSGLVPQADGSCQKPGAPPPPTGISACPSGFAYATVPALGLQLSAGCYSLPIGCPNDMSALESYAAYTGGCCPASFTQAGYSACFPPGSQKPVASTPPICPPGSTLENYRNNTYVCVEKPTCPSSFHVDRNTGLCDRNPIDDKWIDVPPPTKSTMCTPGTVPRFAFTDDQACVSPQTAALTLLQDIEAPSHTKPDGSCMPGFVWRAARASDHVCVTPVVRSQTKSDNQANCPQGVCEAPLVCKDGTTCTGPGAVPPPAPSPAVECPAGEIETDGHCKPAPDKPHPCPQGQDWRNGQCETPPQEQNNCLSNEIWRDGKCVSAPSREPPPPACKDGEILRDGKCEPVPAPAPSCPLGQTMRDGKCEPAPGTACAEGEILRDGKCVIEKQQNSEPPREEHPILPPPRLDRPIEPQPQPREERPQPPREMRRE